MVGKPLTAVHKLFNAELENIALPDTGTGRHQAAPEDRNGMKDLKLRQRFIINKLEPEMIFAGLELFEPDRIGPVAFQLAVTVHLEFKRQVITEAQADAAF